MNEKQNIFKNNLKNNLIISKKIFSLNNKYSYRDKNYKATNEDYSEYYLLLGKDIEPLTIKTEIFISCKYNFI